MRADTAQDLAAYVQPLCGTQNGGNTFPGAVVPFGMMQWSPDTPSGVQGGSEQGGYLYTDPSIVGFSLDHLSGAGGDYGGDFAFTPLLGSVTTSPATSTSNGNKARPSTFSHGNESAAPGYYSVLFDNGIRTELTASTRTGFGRFTYPSGNTASLLINAGSGASITTASLQINVSGNEISGSTTGLGFLGSGQNHTLYFDVVFDQPFTTYGTWSGATLSVKKTSVTGSKIGVYLTFNLPNSGSVLARTGVSWVSVANARANLAAESPAASFNAAGFTAMQAAARASWNAYLNKIQVSGGTAADTNTFYSMLYHSLLAPSVVSDVNNQYIGYDGQVHTASGFNKYEYFSGWDIYRSECQLIAMLDQARASDMAQSLVQDYRESGTMPRWSIPTGDTGIMVGDDAASIIAGMHAFGATNFDTAGALAALVSAAENDVTQARNGIVQRDANRDYLNLGYVPEGEIGGYGPASMTLEYCSDDFALARFAKALGDTSHYASAMSRAQNWRNLYNPDSGYLQMRNSTGAWSAGFPTYGGKGYVEGTAYQYVWMVPHNFGSLTNEMGGAQATSARLDTFFTKLNDTDTTNTHYAYLGNEPCSETPFLYDFLGKPYRCSQVVRQAMTQLYSSAPTGLPGNDDLGQTSSWYVWAALGLYPVIPGDDVLVLNGPLFPQAVLHLTGGDVTINGNGAAAGAPYIQGLTVNGQSSNRPWLRYADLAGGATLTFAMGPGASPGWGADPALAPPSYRDGMTTPVAGSPAWGSGLEAGQTQPTWTNTVDNGSPGGGGLSNVGPVAGPSTPELGVRNETYQSGSAALMYSGQAQGGSTTFAYLKLFDFSSQPLAVAAGMRFSYWIYPQSSVTSSLVSGRNSAYVALDFVCTDGTTLRGSGLRDQDGVGIHPSLQGASLALDTWNYVTVDLTPLAGKAVNRVSLGYDQGGSTGGYRGYVDDIAFTVSPFAGSGRAPLTAFLRQYGLPVADPTLDSDGDGVSNLLEFVLGSNPIVPDAAGLPVAKYAVVGGVDSLVYTFYPATNLGGVTWVVETSTDLVNWTTAANGVNGVTVAVSPYNASANRAVVTIPRTAGNSLFARLRATVPSP